MFFSAVDLDFAGCTDNTTSCLLSQYKKLFNWNKCCESLSVVHPKWFKCNKFDFLNNISRNNIKVKDKEIINSQDQKLTVVYWSCIRIKQNVFLKAKYIIQDSTFHGLQLLNNDSERIHNSPICPLVWMFHIRRLNSRTHGINNI